MATELNFKQELTACFGQPVAENPTQVMMEAAYRHHGLDWRYLTFGVAPAGLGHAVRGARAMGFRGLNLTIPHKVAVVEHLDRLSPAATLIGAVNCVVREGDALVGENTDGAGFLAALGRRRDCGRRQSRGKRPAAAGWGAYATMQRADWGGPRGARPSGQTGNNLRERGEACAADPRSRG